MTLEEGMRPVELGVVNMYQPAVASNDRKSALPADPIPCGIADDATSRGRQDHSENGQMSLSSKRGSSEECSFAW